MCLTIVFFLLLLHRVCRRSFSAIVSPRRSAKISGWYLSWKLQLPIKIYIQMLCVNPRQQLSSTQPFAHFTPQWDGERIRGAKLKMSWDKDSFICKLDGACESKEINSLLPISRQIFSPFQESKTLHAMATWKDKCLTEHLPFLLALPPFLLMNTTSFGMGFPFGQMSQLCSLPTSCVPLD